MAIRIPVVKSCCGCVTDLKCAAAIIAVLAIVTSPALSWAIVRHSYVIRMSCYVTTSDVRADIVDINLNNVVSFGFGANAGLNPSCLSKIGQTGQNKTNARRTTQLLSDMRNSNSTVDTAFVSTVKCVGWLVLLVDLIFFGASLNFLYRLFHAPEKRSAVIFIWTAIVSMFFSFIYGMLYVAACVSIGGSFPVFEFGFCVIDVCYNILQLFTDETIKSSVPKVWIYFLIVVQSYRMKSAGVNT